MKKICALLALVLLLGVLTSGLTGCKQVEEAAENTADSANDSQSNVGDPVNMDPLKETSCGCENGFTEGNGSAKAPYQIATAVQLAHAAEHGDAYLILKNDIEQSGNWTSFDLSGHFNGAGYAIRNLDAPLFSFVGADAAVRDLTISGEMTAVGDKFGSLTNELAGAVKNVTSFVRITVPADAPDQVTVGGLVGYSTGTVANSTYSGGITDARDSNSGGVGAIIGRSGVVASEGLPVMITAHAGFAAPGGASDKSEDNTIDNMIKAINYGPDAIEVDVQSADSDGDGVREMWLGHDGVDYALNPSLEDALLLLLGEHERSDELDPAYADTVRIQLDSKEDGNLDEILAVIEELNVPWERVILAGDNSYDHVMQNIDAIRKGVEQGMDFWMNPDFILSYQAMSTRSDEFIARIEALKLPVFTVNSDYDCINEKVQEWLTGHGLRISVWTLNRTNDIRNNITRGFYNNTSRLPEILEIRDLLKTGVSGNIYDQDAGLPEIGF